ncbi:MAG: anaerobic glycerol-3-phosphate dehydrogenase subunit C, partial [Halodesulfurarchaeum sp.]|nr:anaerobic glycerol-3-phosphate dehydrogenase subunit C [Halodesulfurarchaeum sp.]
GGRDRLLANYRTSAWLASKLPRLANAVMGSGPVRWLLDRTLGVTAEREFPEFVTETFREWWDGRGGPAESRARAREHRERLGHDLDADLKVAYFHGCYANYNTPEVGKAMVRVFEHFGYEVIVPEQRCSGTPMFANGMLADARRHAEVNVDSLGTAIEAGYSIITSCTSCSMALRQEYPELFELSGIDTLAGHTWEAMEFLRAKTDIAAELGAASVDEDEFGTLAYHAPCHARDQGLDGQPVELFAPLDGADAADVGDSCSGISGTYGWKDEHYDTSMAIGREMFEHMDRVDGETGLTECPTCASQMEHGTGDDVCHPLEVIEAALVE